MPAGNAKNGVGDKTQSLSFVTVTDPFDLQTRILEPQDTAKMARANAILSSSFHVFLFNRTVVRMRTLISSAA